MSELKQILTFISFSFRRFFVNLASHLGYLFVTVAVTLPVFFIGYKSFKSHTFFIGFLVLLVILNFYFRRFMVFTHQIRLNAMFVRYLNNKDAFFQDDANKREPAIGKETVKKVRTDLKQQGFFIMPAKLLAAYTALHVETPVDFSKEKPMGNGLYYKFMVIQIFLFLVLLLPFVLISFFFTMGLALPVKMLVYLMGFFFVYFLNASIVDPIISLKMVERLSKT